MKRVALTILLCLALLTGCGPAAAPVEPTTPLIETPPAADARFPGRLAYVRGGQVFTRDGATGRDVSVGPGHSPAWSSDGQWLAFSGAEGLHLTKSDGTGLVTISDLASIRQFKWSPAEPLLAVATEAGLYTVSPSAATRTLATHPHGIPTFAWAPDGKQIAYTSMDLKAGAPPADTIWTIPKEGGAPTRVLRDEQNALYLAGWWPDGQGLYYWLGYMHSASMAADGLPLFSLSFASAKPQVLTQMLSTSRWLSHNGQRFLATVGTGRMLWTGKSLALCDNSACTPLPQPENGVTLDGTWAPDGRQIAFVRAEARSGDAKADGWISTRTLWVADPDGQNARQIKNAGNGIVAPTWISPTELLFARGEGLWIITTADEKPREVTKLDSPGGQLSVSYAWHP